MPSSHPAHRLGLVALALVLLPVSARAQNPWEYDHDVRLSYEFDDNVGEETINRDRAQVARLAYSGDVLWGAAGEQRLSLSYQGGFKRHFGLAGDALGEEPQLDIANQFVNEGTVGYLRRVTDDVAVGATVGLKNRKWMDGFFFINEDGFTQKSAGVNAAVTLAPLALGRPARLDVGGRWSTIDFKNLDQAFGNHSRGGYASLSKPFGEDVDATWSYAYDQIHYPGRGVLTALDTDPANILRGTTRDRQEDHLHELGVEVTRLGDFAVQAEYRFLYNVSNSFGFTYVSHNLGVQFLRRLPWDLTAQVYGQIELRSFAEPVPNFTGGSLDVGEAESNVLLLRLVKDVSPDYAMEVRYGRYRNESITLNDFYTKNIYAVGITYRP